MLYLNIEKLKRMNKTNLFYSSIGKKLIVALAGGFLLVFLLVHLGINLLLLVNDNGTLFNEASHFMGTNFVIKVMQHVLAFGLLLHVVFAIIVTLKNWTARPSKYYTSNSSETSFFSKYMIHTGGIILAFLVIHLLNFFYKMKFTEMTMSDYDLVSGLFVQWQYSVFYIVCFLFMGFHLNHAFQSAFQTLGFNHNKYTPTLKLIGLIYSLIIAGGFSAIPIFFLIR